MSRPRAAVVVTGSELVRGDRTDLNGPFLAHELAVRGLEPARVSIVGDAPQELESVLAESMESDLCVVSGGLGPTHDDRTVELLARVAGRELRLDPELATEIEAISRRVAERLRRPYADFAAGVRKQASLPAGAVSLGLAGTAPGMALERDGKVVVALPGPPAELQRLWPRALETAAVRLVLERARPPDRRILRAYGISESMVARAFAEAGGDGDGVEATICAHELEIHVDLFVREGGEARAAALLEALRTQLAPHVFAEDERPVEEIVLSLCRDRGLTLGTAESCTGGLVGARLTGRPGSSDVFRGGIVAYADDVKVAELGVPPEVIERNGAVSAATAEAMADGARSRLGVDVAVSVTGVAGPGGGTPEKPVGLVHISAVGPSGRKSRELRLHGDREAVRRRAAAAALHAVRALLTQNRDEER